MRTRNNMTSHYPSLRGHSNSFRHYETGSDKEQMYVTMHRKRSSSISTIPKFETSTTDIVTEGWMTTIQPGNWIKKRVICILKFFI